MEMSKPIKIVILIVAIIASVSAVLLFAKTQAQPPIDMHFPNSHKLALEQDIKSMNEAFPNEDFFSLIVSEMEFQTKEGLIDTLQRDSVADLLMMQYVPLFRKYCWKCFETQEWDANSMAAIENRVRVLQSFKHLQSSSTVLDKYEALSNRVDTIVRVVDDYNTAINLVRHTGFVSANNSRNAVSKANELKNKYPLRNYTSLVGQLDSLRYQLERGHYQWLISRFDMLELDKLHNYWRNNLKDSLSFESFCLSLNNSLNDYKNASFYPNRRDVSNMIDSTPYRRNDAKSKYFTFRINGRIR